MQAEISHSTEQEILNQYIGHFDETNFINGNVGLAAHNRGFDVNYFENIHKLNYGDEIYYTINGITYKYIVNVIEIIQDTNWSYLGKTNNNKITLITCVINQPDKRLCVQAEIESEEYRNIDKKIFNNNSYINYSIKHDINWDK